MRTTTGFARFLTSPARTGSSRCARCKRTKTRATIERYFRAIEAGTIKPEPCTEKVRDLTTRLEGLEAEKRDVGGRRKRLELPAIDREMISTLVNNFEQVIAAGTNPQEKHLLHRLVKKVLVHDRRTVEIRYALPNHPRFVHRVIWLLG